MSTLTMFRSVTIIALFLTSCGFKTSQTSASTIQGGDDSSQALVFAKRIVCKDVPVNYRPEAGVPLAPDLKMTPGKLCDEPVRRRYPENIKYCDRGVGRDGKDQVFVQYESRGQLRHNHDGSDEFKVDHLIPLCVGGSNDQVNLWPQHKSIGEFTDPVEPRICALMAQGKMKQADAVKIIQGVKQDYKTSGAVCRQLSRLLGI